jgi:hypothetical protein
MIAYNGNNEKSSRRNLKCAVCRINIDNKTKTYQSRTTFSVVCHNCNKKFSNEDIELMLNLFLAYGGYFGQFKDNKGDKYSIKTVIEDTLRNFKRRNLNFDELNMRLLHIVLLYGFTPSEYIKNLKLLLEK